MTCHCANPTVLFLQNKPTTCVICGEEFKCPALPALEDKKSSRPSGAKPKNEPSDSEDLTLRQSNSVKLILNALSSQAARITEQQHQITELTKGVEYLAQQVKTLVDALAEDQDPDAPLTHYMSGKPI